MNLNQIFCFHKYEKVVEVVGFYGVSCLYLCEKCQKHKTIEHGYPALNDPKTTRIIHHNEIKTNGKAINH